ncbi:hypothetical protein AGLY_018286 [Aphis glycines]|uniref:Uncharacterized protein n=1 Tax=Aphis glycines TaxID=307491 RepID=A0A6G0SUI8_APHGL|nr:hypothetical protein AGLY_018286 [Aphis glycines]
MYTGFSSRTTYELATYHRFEKPGLRTAVVVDSERSDECIDFTIMYVFLFVFVYSITSRNNASISNFGGGFRWKRVKSKHYPIVLKKNREKPKKNDGKTGIFTQNQFSIFLYGCNSKTNHCKHLKFSQNVYTTEIFDLCANFFLKCRSNFYEICRKCENLQFLICYSDTFEVQILTKIRQNYEYLQIILSLKHKPPFSPTTGNYILG